MKGRYFGGKKVDAYIHDGVEKFDQVTDEQDTNWLDSIVLGESK